MAKLIDLYWERFSQEPLDLEDFLHEVQQGRHGSFRAAEIVQFIEDVEAITLRNIEVKAREGPVYEQMKQSVIEQTRERMRALIDEYGKDAGF